MNKLLFTDSRFHYPWSICLFQLIRWIHPISKPKSKKHDCRLNNCLKSGSLDSLLVPTPPCSQTIITSCVLSRNIAQTLLKNTGGHKSFLWGHWYPCFGLLEMLPLFQGQGVFLACMLCHLHVRVSSDSPLVWQLLTSWWPAWQLRFLDPRTCRSCIHKHWWGSNLRPNS